VTVDGLVASCELDKVVAAVDEMSWKDFCIAFGSVFHMAMYFVLQKDFDRGIVMGSHWDQANHLHMCNNVWRVQI
jgi:hypothetical protein